MKRTSILMALNGLDIGGAETHVVELAKELTRNGYRIVVASAGGVYESELESCGIRHYRVPLNKRSFSEMLKSYFMLGKIIKKEKIDIVHAHARIPGFICGLLRRKLNFTFVSTAHWVFDAHGSLRYLTNWGTKVIAVSDDIKKYLIDNYNVDEKNIFVTINGIDTEKFSPINTGSKIKKEFGIKDNENVLVYVSRMDEDRALAAEMIIKSAAELDKSIENLRIIIAGGGNVFDRLKAESDEINNKLSKNLIIMTGARTDINEIVACSKVFVGVSRAALEAMSSGKLVVLAGNEGYLGIFNEKIINKAMENNLCCRNCAETKADVLCRDIIYAFNNIGDEERQKLGEYGRNIIFKYYSVNKMANDCIKAYEAALADKKKYRVLMSGYYGFNNAGDDAILLSIYSNIKKLNKNIDVTVLANKPEITGKKYGVKMADRLNVLSIIKAVKNCDLLLSGGGSLLQDRTSTRSLVYYLSIICLSKLFGKKVMLYANGIGPVIKPQNRKLVKKVVSEADLITLREEKSLEELRNMGVTNKNAIVTADPVFTLECVPKERSYEILKEIGIEGSPHLIGVSVRNWKNIDNFVEDLAGLCDDIIEKTGRKIVFISMQVPYDTYVSQKVMSKMRNKSYILKDGYTPTELMGVIGLMDMVISMRLHTLIFAANQRVPMLGFIYDPKIDYYLQLFDMPSGGDINVYDMNSAFTKVKDILDNRDVYVKKLEKTAGIMELKAEENVKYLLKLLQTDKRGRNIWKEK